MYVNISNSSYTLIRFSNRKLRAIYLKFFFNKSKLYSVIRIEALAHLIASTEFHTVAPGLSPVCRHRGNIGKLLYSICALSPPRGQYGYMAHETSCPDEWKALAPYFGSPAWMLPKSWGCYGLYRSRQVVICKSRARQFIVFWLWQSSSFCLYWGLKNDW